jgi:uncharacterized membrane protein
MNGMSSAASEQYWESIQLADLERWASLATATAVMAYGLSRRSMPGVCLAVAAAPLAYRGFSGDWPRFGNGNRSANLETRAALAGSRGMHVLESVRLEQPLDETYRFWRNLENLPRFMRHLERVTELGDGRSRWTAAGPAGVAISWEAEVINEVENKLIAWRSLPGSDVVTAGSVQFDTVRGGRSTQVTVNLQYAPPAGKAGAYLARLFGREPSQMIREDLRQMKQLLEAGEIARATADR